MTLYTKFLEDIKGIFEPFIWEDVPIDDPPIIPPFIPVLKFPDTQKNLFSIESHKRGRKTHKNGPIIHRSDSFDNLLRKIQVHFLNFLIDFCNEALKTEYENSDYSFKQINYKVKEEIEYSYLKNLKHCSIKDILNFDINIFHVERREIRLGKYSTHKINKQILYHFLKFLINFCNDALEEENLNIHYPNDSGLIKFLFPQRYYIFYSHFNLKEKTIEDILKLDIPAQLPIFGDGNRKLLEKIGSLSPRLTNLFKMKVLKLFKYYYNKEKPLNKISFENKEIYLSPRTKTFYDLLGKKKNRLKEFILVAKNYYLLEKNDS